MFIEANLHRKDLSIGLIAKSTNLSRSTLYRIVSSAGGVAQFVIDQRVQALKKALKAEGELRPFSSVARAHGFVSVAHAHRKFHLAYGITPGAFRRSCMRAAAESPTPPAASNRDSDDHRADQPDRSEDRPAYGDGRGRSGSRCLPRSA